MALKIIRQIEKDMTFIGERGTYQSTFKEFEMFQVDANYCNESGQNLLVAYMAFCRNINPEVVDQILKTRIKINKVDEDDYSALFYACESQYVSPEVIEMMISAGCDIKPNKKGDCALHYYLYATYGQCPKKDERVLKAFIEAGVMNFFTT